MWTYFIGARGLSYCNVDRWADVKHVIARVHSQVCGISSRSDIQLLLIRNGFWSDDTRKCLTALKTRCGACQPTEKPRHTAKCHYLRSRASSAIWSSWTMALLRVLEFSVQWMLDLDNRPPMSSMTPLSALTLCTRYCLVRPILASDFYPG